MQNSRVGILAGGAIGLFCLVAWAPGAAEQHGVVFEVETTFVDRTADVWSFQVTAVHGLPKRTGKRAKADPGIVGTLQFKGTDEELQAVARGLVGSTVYLSGDCEEVRQSDWAAKARLEGRRPWHDVIVGFENPVGWGRFEGLIGAVCRS